MVMLVLLGLTFFIQLLAASWYDLAVKTQKKEVFKYKMLCSGTYIADILLCAAISSPFTKAYFWLISAGYICFFVSDIAETKSEKQNLPNLLKAIAVIFITSSISVRVFTQFPQILTFFSIKLILIVCAVTALLIFVISKDGFSRKLLLSGTWSMVMLALLFGIMLQSSGSAQMQASSCAVVLGSLSLAASLVLNVSILKDIKSLWRVNLYYFGLMFLACSVI